MEPILYKWTSFDGKYHQGIVGLRFAVYVDEQKVPVEEEIDLHDPEASHLVALSGETVVATLRIVRVGKSAKIGRLAVDAAFRRQGIAREMMVQALTRVRNRDFTDAVVESQLYIRPFYASFGFRETGDVFLDAGIQHKKMVLKIR